MSEGGHPQDAGLTVLNAGDLGEVVNGDEDVAKSLRTELMRLKGRFMNDAGLVDYEAMADSPEFSEYEKLARRLRNVDLGAGDVGHGMSEETRKVFFINLYNCLMVHTVVATHRLVQKLASPLDIAPNVYSRMAYNVGGHDLSLDDMEHGILRANRSHPKSGRSSHFGPDDPRGALALSTLDPRIHFALNCGAVSCPPIRVYSVADVDQQLDLATTTYNLGGVRLREATKEVELPKIYLWYGGDFGASDCEVLNFVADALSRSDPDLSLKLRRAAEPQEGYKIHHGDYDWTLNASGPKLI